MKEISNKTLTFFLAIAIVISLGGTFISLSRLTLLGVPITGLATTGIVNLSVTELTSVSVTNQIDFGAGYINESRTSYVMLYGNNSNYRAENGNGSWDWRGKGLLYFLIENDGNTNVTINISSNESAATLLGGGIGNIPAPLFEYAIIFELGDACNGTYNAEYVWTTLTTTNSTVCRFFYYNASSDKINVSVRLGVPEDAHLGHRSALLEFANYKYTGS